MRLWRNAKTNVMALGAATALVLALGASLGAAGCSGSDGNANTDGGGRGGASGSGGGNGGASGGGTLTWKDDGAMHTAPFATASLVTQSGIQLLQVAGGEASGIGIAFGVTAMPAPLPPGTYSCGISDGGGYPITSFSYTADGVDPLYESCSVTIATLGDADGEHTTGTFSAVLTKTAGGTKAITDGSFDLALNVTP